MPHPYYLRVAYEGTAFFGWQVQSVLRTAQGELWAALGRIQEEAQLPHGTGRTDAGVHAEAQGVVVQCLRAWDPYRLQSALNAHLPEDIKVMDAQAAPEGFWPRQHAVAKRYRYRLAEGPAEHPIHRRYRWHVHGADPLDREAMREAAAAWIGTHDFSSFRNAECVAASPVRTIHDLRLEESHDGLDLVFEGTAFLMHQVRIMTGTLVQVGKHRLAAEAAPSILAALDRKLAGATAPPQGLCLEKVWYQSRWGIGEPSPWSESLPEFVLEEGVD
jgi:tRNA pseudouridine38-40 synthase